jgi:hypothetical protein
MTPAQMQARITELEAQLGKRKRAPRKADPERARRAQFRLEAQQRRRRGCVGVNPYCRYSVF